MNIPNTDKNVSKLTCQWTPTSGLIPTINKRDTWKQTIVARISCVVLAILSVPMVAENVVMIPAKVVVLAAKGVVYTVTFGHIILDKNKRASVRQIGGHLVKALAYLVGITAFLGFFAPRFATWSHNKLGLVYAQDFESKSKREIDLSGHGPNIDGSSPNSVNPPRPQLAIEIENNIKLAKENEELKERVAAAEVQLKEAQSEVNELKSNLAIEAGKLLQIQQRMSFLENQNLITLETKNAVEKELNLLKDKHTDLFQTYRLVVKQNEELEENKQKDLLIHKQATLTNITSYEATRGLLEAERDQAKNERDEAQQKLDAALLDNEKLQKMLNNYLEKESMREATKRRETLTPSESGSVPSLIQANGEMAVSVSSSSTQNTSLPQAPGVVVNASLDSNTNPGSENVGIKATVTNGVNTLTSRVRTFSINAITYLADGLLQIQVPSGPNQASENANQFHENGLAVE